MSLQHAAEMLHGLSDMFADSSEDVTAEIEEGTHGAPGQALGRRITITVKCPPDIALYGLAPGPFPPNEMVAVDGHDLKQLVPGMLILDRLRTAMLADDVVWLLPRDLLPGVTMYRGYPVVHADVKAPMLAHRPLTPGEGLAAELEAANGPVTEAELEQLRRAWPPADVGDVVPGRIARTLPVGSVVLWTGAASKAPESDSARRHSSAGWEPPIGDADQYRVVRIGPPSVTR